MKIKVDTTATLFRSNPQYIDEYGTPGIQLSSNDAYVEIEAIMFDQIREKTQLAVRCVERKKNSDFILPIQEKFGLDFQYLQAYGFLFPVLSVEMENNKERVFRITLEFDPSMIDSRTIISIPLTARYIGNGRIELEQFYDHEMRNPYCMRGKHASENRLIKLHRDNSNNQIFTLDGNVELEKNERVKILSNWDPSAIQRK